MSFWMLCRQAWSGCYTIGGDIKEAQCVLVGGVRHGQTIQPGLSNEDLAGNALRHFAHLPKIPQGEVADAYLHLASDSHVERVDHHRQAGRYLDTREVADQARRIMELRGWRTAALLAHAHLTHATPGNQWISRVSGDNRQEMYNAQLDIE